MSINIPVPDEISAVKFSLWVAIKEICRRALDVSINPAQVNVGIKVVGNDVTIATAGNGLVLTSRDGTKTFRLVVDNDGALALDRLT